MRMPRPLWVICVISSWLIINSPLNVYAQEQQQGKITFTVLAKEMLPPVDKHAHRIIIKDKKEILTGSLSVKEGKRTLSVAKRADITLPHNLPALISGDGSVILQYGDPKLLYHPNKTDLHWLSADGKKLASLEDYYHAGTLVALSTNGFTTVVGKRLKNSKTKVVSLFTPNGERLWEYPLGRNRNISSEPVVTVNGERVVVVTTDKKSSIRHHRVLVLDNQGKKLTSIDTLGIVQKKVIVGNGKALFIQGKKRHGLIDLKTGKVIWANSDHLRLVGPRAAAMNPNTDTLFLMTADWHGRPQATYQWRLYALDANNGQVLGTWKLPQEKPGTRTDVFGRITDERITIFFGAEQLSISWSR